MTRDPVGYKAGDFNLYGYCGNEPLNRVDHNGTWYWVNGKGDYCGPYVKLYTGWWCVKPNIWEAAMDAAGGVVNCWWKCEVTTHKCVGGKILTGTEIVSGAVGGLGARIPKTPGEYWVYGDTMKSLLREIAKRVGVGGGAAKVIARSKVVAVSKGVFVVTLFIEAGISAKCGISCK